MILNKRGFMMLPLAALLFATSCAKQISYQEAVDFVTTNYTSKDPKKPTKLAANFFANIPNADTRKTIEGMIKPYLPELTEEGDNLKYNGEIKDNLPDMYVITTEYLMDPSEDEDFKVTYSLNGKSLSFNFDASFKNETIDVVEGMITVNIKNAKIDGSAGVNDQGYPTNAKAKVDLDATITMNIQPVSGFASNETIDLKLTGDLSVNATY